VGPPEEEALQEAALQEAALQEDEAADTKQTPLLEKM
jgi:hypothetical protein